ncbi:DUF362 domain-containing protein [Phenylobacterium sp.]|uniref:DUF362 domain-containing protein n=1 Tax=Phenylobacterium sp. TaxID=1871053 RepID=UPI0025D09F5E|nr:DUF362 domain-containing protein [Phenylobacterium sp.]MBX3484891.1 DUF362 domain-containing protein [Phenylobacterium sp.]
MDPVVAIAHAPGADAGSLLDRALELAGFHAAMAERVAQALSARGACSAVVVPAMDAFAADSPAAADPALVERLLDVLFDLGVTDAVVGSTRATAALWLENRDVFVAADLLGYRYETPAGRPYEVVDLAEEVRGDVFPAWGALAGTPLSGAWLDADLRLVVAANRTDEDDGYALCLSTLLSVLPLTDKDYHYRYRRDAGEVTAELLAAAPPHFAVVDAVVSAHGAAGGRAPHALRTDTVIAASDAALADYIGALKMGLDPFVSPLAAPSLRAARPAAGTRILGPLEAWPGWINVEPGMLAAAAARRGFVTADRALRPALQQVDRELFPFRHPANDWMNRTFAPLAGAGDGGADGARLVAAVNLLLGEAERAGTTWGVLFDKDALRRRETRLNIDPAAVTDAEYDALAADLSIQAELLRGVAADARGLRWRFDDGAVLFDGARRFPVPFDAFAGAVPIHRAIQFMNDYAGGRALATGLDAEGRVVRQLERNLYLPQPNYTAVGGGMVIDVTKIETVEYAPRRQRMFWKTVKSENGSAVVDDGIVTFEALGEDTLVTIWGRQQFRLPPLWAALDRELAPDVKRALVADAYHRFLDRTFANLEAAAEGRDVRLGRSWSDASEGEPLPVEQAAELLKRLPSDGRFDLAGAVKALLRPQPGSAPQPVRIDADGFRHFEAAPAAVPSPLGTAMSGALEDLRHAAWVDAGAQS